VGVADTLVGVECDQECKWALGLTRVNNQAFIEKSKLPVQFPYGNEDPRFTDESYDAADAIDAELLGIQGLMAACDRCDRKACEIEAQVDRTDVEKYGRRIIDLIKDLKG
jgi:hypothetical protein